MIHRDDKDARQIIHTGEEGSEKSILLIAIAHYARLIVVSADGEKLLYLV